MSDVVIGQLKRRLFGADWQMVASELCNFRFRKQHICRHSFYPASLVPTFWLTMLHRKEEETKRGWRTYIGTNCRVPSVTLWWSYLCNIRQHVTSISKCKIRTLLKKLAVTFPLLYLLGCHFYRMCSLGLKLFQCGNPLRDTETIPSGDRLKPLPAPFSLFYYYRIS